jgi:hypothetical protein
MAYQREWNGYKSNRYDGHRRQPIRKVPKNKEDLLAILRKMRTDPEIPTNDECLIYAAEGKEIYRVIEQVREHIAQIWKAEAMEDPTVGLDLTMRHNYGNDVDIMRASFSKSKEEIASETNDLIVAIRDLFQYICCINWGAPKYCKYGICKHFSDSVEAILGFGVKIKMKYYRQNLLEQLHCECETLREYAYNARTNFEDWITELRYHEINIRINKVTVLIGSLLKASVAELPIEHEH